MHDLWLVCIAHRKHYFCFQYYPTTVSCWSVDTAVTRCHEACCFGLNEEHNHKGSKVGKVTQKGVWKCKVCDGDVDGGLSVGCDACLDWFHGRCVGIITTPKNNLDM